MVTVQAYNERDGIIWTRIFKNLECAFMKLKKRKAYESELKEFQLTGVVESLGKGVVYRFKNRSGKTDVE